jgi:hypothetical protein
MGETLRGGRKMNLNSCLQGFERHNRIRSDGRVQLPLLESSSLQGQINPEIGAGEFVSR